MAQLGEPVGREAAATPAPLPSGYLLAALVLLLVAPPALAGWVAGVWVVRVGWVSRGRLAAAGGVTGALAVLLIGLTRAAGGLLGAVAALGGAGCQPTCCWACKARLVAAGDGPTSVRRWVDRLTSTAA